PRDRHRRVLCRAGAGAGGAGTPGDRRTRGADEECFLRDHLLAAHPNTVQPETLGVLLKHFVVTERPRRQRSCAHSTARSRSISPTSSGMRSASTVGGEG